MLRVAGFLLAIVGSCHMTSIQTHSFMVSDDARYGSSRLGDSWITRSMVTCLLECKTKYPTCFSAVYNTQSNLCTPGGKLTFGSGKPSSMFGDTFYYTDPCNTSLGYKLFVYNSVVECLYVSPNWAVYLTARSICTAKGGRVMQAKTQDKYNLFVHIARNIIKFNTFLGLTDIITEGTYVWEDGELLNNTWKTQIFIPGEPNDVNGAENCATIGSYKNFKALFDGYCSYTYYPDYRYYICERSP